MYTSCRACLKAQMIKNLPAMQETQFWSLGPARSPGERNGNPLQYYCLENSMDRGVWWATVHGSQRVRHSWVTNTFSFSLPLIYRWTVTRTKQSRFLLQMPFFPPLGNCWLKDFWIAECLIWTQPFISIVSAFLTAKIIRRFYEDEWKD